LKKLRFSSPVGIMIALSLKSRYRIDF